MVDFGGWDMPVNYGSQIEEHHAVRTDAGMFDVSHMCVVDLKAPQCARLPARPAGQQRRQAAGAGQGPVLLHAESEGGVIDDLIVYFFARPGSAWWSTPAPPRRTSPGSASATRPPASRPEITPRRADLSDEGIALVAVQGPNARAKVWHRAAAREASEA
jgi:aminomethyltransferase